MRRTRRGFLSPVPGRSSARTGASARGIRSRFSVFSGSLHSLSERSESTPIRRGPWTVARELGDGGPTSPGSLRSLFPATSSASLRSRSTQQEFEVASSRERTEFSTASVVRSGAKHHSLPGYRAHSRDDRPSPLCTETVPTHFLKP
jgi:hypothetical protein